MADRGHPTAAGINLTERNAIEFDEDDNAIIIQKKGFWRPQWHITFSPSFKDTVLAFTLCNQRLAFDEFSPYLPLEMIWEILDFVQHSLQIETERARRICKRYRIALTDTSWM